jgi:hypothetical protein
MDLTYLPMKFAEVLYAFPRVVAKGVYGFPRAVSERIYYATHDEPENFNNDRALNDVLSPNFGGFTEGPEVSSGEGLPIFILAGLAILFLAAFLKD